MTSQPKRLWVKHKTGWIALAVILVTVIVHQLASSERTALEQVISTAPMATPLLASSVRQVTQVPATQERNTRPEPGNALILSEQLKWQFDDLIHTADGNESALPGLLDKLATRLSLSTNDTSYLRQLFSRYHQYLLAVTELKQSVDPENLLSIDDTRGFLRRAHRLQFEFFSNEEIAAFFGDANRYDLQALERMATQQSHDAVSLKQQLDTLPEEDRKVLLPSVEALAITESLSGGQSPTELTPEQQQKIEQFQHQNHQWQQRVAKVVRLQQQLVGEPDAEARLKAYLSSEFTGIEQRRLDVFLRHPDLLN